MAEEEQRQLNRGAAAKARAKELRKATEKRAEKKEQRHKEKREQQASSSAGAATPRAYDSSKGTTASKAASSSDVCKFFLDGTCNKGDKCRFQHVIVDAAAPAAEEYASGGAAAATGRDLGGARRGVLADGGGRADARLGWGPSAHGRPS